MEQNVLTIEQMKTLLSLGLNATKASMFYDVIPHWNKETNETYITYNEIPKWRNSIAPIYFTTRYGKEIIPALTLSDIIEILPKRIGGYKLNIEFNFKTIEYADSEDFTIFSKNWTNGNLIDAAFELLRDLLKSRDIRVFSGD